MKLGGLLLVLGGVLLAQDDMHEEIKHILHPNMTHLYLEDPQDVENLEEMFTKGVFYGRVRFSSFGFKWKEELNIGNTPIRKDHAIAAMGGSLIYRSGYLNGFGVGAGLYVSEALGTLKKDEVYLYKAGKDTFSRYDKLTDGDNGIISFAQAYLEYKYSQTHVKYGRQIFESFLTKSNDTKMIPNTFEGITLQSKDIPQTTFKAAYLTRQKLRDHSEFHHVLAYASDPNEPYYYSYTENDDSAVHRGLTLEKLQARGIDDRLIVLEAKNQSIDNLTLYANYTGLPDLFSSAMIQTDYLFEAGEWKLIPGVRYMQQFDNGAGEIGGASRKGLAASQFYKNPNSLESWLFGARLDCVYHNIKLRAAYTRVADQADIIAPWRGFPTGGFTRAMGQYNWDANTKTYMLQFGYQPESFYGIRMVARYAVQDFDDTKPSEQADSNVFTLDILKGFDGMSRMYTKLRYAHVTGESDIPLVGTTGYKLDPSYDEVRFEINYLF